ncbi:MAG TPA: hypothetical protein VEZ44_00155, partial [bacterium]|nr:hypothetical protein [bacterium]
MTDAHGAGAGHRARPSGETGGPPAARIVSLVPSATEIVCRLGLADRLVGVSADCDFPPDLRGIPALSRPVIAPGLPSPAIDRRIRAGVHTGTSVYHLDEAVLAGLHPDVILTQ